MSWTFFKKRCRKCRLVHTELHQELERVKRLNRVLLEVLSEAGNTQILDLIAEKDKLLREKDEELNQAKERIEFMQNQTEYKKQQSQEKYLKKKKGVITWLSIGLKGRKTEKEELHCENQNPPRSVEEEQLEKEFQMDVQLLEQNTELETEDTQLLEQNTELETENTQLLEQNTEPETEDTQLLRQYAEREEQLQKGVHHRLELAQEIQIRIDQEE